MKHNKGKKDVLSWRGFIKTASVGAGALGSAAENIYSMAGHNWAEFLAFGHIARRNAAAEKPWS